MKKTLAILLVLVLACFGLFVDGNTNGSTKILMNSVVDEFIAIGVSPARLVTDDFVS